MSGQVSRGSAGEYQADEWGVIARTTWRLSVRSAGRCREAQLASIIQMSVAQLIPCHPQSPPVERSQTLSRDVLGFAGGVPRSYIEGHEGHDQGLKPAEMSMGNCSKYAFIQKITRSAAFSGGGDGGWKRCMIIITKISALLKTCSYIKHTYMYRCCVL